jgi:hypothetical protein
MCEHCDYNGPNETARPEPSWRDPVPETHERCMHCGAYADECMCDGGISWGNLP